MNHTDAIHWTRQPHEQWHNPQGVPFEKLPEGRRFLLKIECLFIANVGCGISGIQWWNNIHQPVRFEDSVSCYGNRTISYACPINWHPLGFIEACWPDLMEEVPFTVPVNMQVEKGYRLFKIWEVKAITAKDVSKVSEQQWTEMSIFIPLEYQLPDHLQTPETRLRYAEIERRIKHQP